MIVRILGEGQRELPEEHISEVNKVDQLLMDAVLAGDEVAFARQLVALLALVRTVGVPVPVDVLTLSDSVLPAETSSLAEVRQLLDQQELIPE